MLVTTDWQSPSLPAAGQRVVRIGHAGPWQPWAGEPVDGPDVVFLGTVQAVEGTRVLIAVAVEAKEAFHG